jgi:hypothetical protein
VLDSIQAMSLLTIMEIKGPVLLRVLIYGTIQWSRRRRGPTEAVREGATRQLYREAAKAEAREGRNPPRREVPTASAGWCREANRPCILTGLLRTLSAIRQPELLSCDGFFSHFQRDRSWPSTSRSATTRKGAVRGRSQLETKIMGEKHWTKRSKESGQCMDQKDNKGKFKGVRQEK